MPEISFIKMFGLIYIGVSTHLSYQNVLHGELVMCAQSSIENHLTCAIHYTLDFKGIIAHVNAPI